MMSLGVTSLFITKAKRLTGKRRSLYAYWRLRKILNRKMGLGYPKALFLGTTITIARLAKRRYESLFAYYEKVAPHINEPLYTRLVQWCERPWGTSLTDVYSIRHRAYSFTILIPSTYNFINLTTFFSHNIY